MNRAKPQMRIFATRLIDFEANGNKSVMNKQPAAFQVWDKLRPQLETLMGKGGFRILLSRSLALSSGEVPALRAVRVDTDNPLQGLAELQSQLNADELFGARVVLLAQLLGLLETFIGEKLTLRLVRETWPKLSFNDSDFTQGDKNEKTN